MPSPAAARARAYRRRRREGLLAITVELPADLTALLVMRDYLSPEDVGDRRKVAEAVSEMLRDVADEL